MVSIAALAVVALLGIAAAGAGLRWSLQPALASAPPAIFNVNAGVSLGQVARDLEARGLIRSAFALKLLARYRNLDGALQVGEYELSAALAPEEILTRIVEGRVVTYEVSIPEGLTAAQIAPRIEAAELGDAAEFLAFASDPASAA